MSLLTGEPPYDEIEIERIAQAFACGRAYWCWYSSREAQHVFAMTLFKMPPMDRVKLAEKGAIILFEFVDGDRRLLPNDLPRMTTMKWMGIEHARKALHRARILEWQNGAKEIPTEAVLDLHLNSYEQARRESLPELRRLAASVTPA